MTKLQILLYGYSLFAEKTKKWYILCETDRTVCVIKFFLRGMRCLYLETFTGDCNIKFFKREWDEIPASKASMLLAKLWSSKSIGSKPLESNKNSYLNWGSGSISGSCVIIESYHMVYQVYGYMMSLATTLVSPIHSHLQLSKLQVLF